jgi:hypothetical protein
MAVTKVRDEQTTQSVSLTAEVTGILPVANGGTGASSIPTWNQNTTGSAATLTTARNIHGVSFNGSANITLIPRVVSPAVAGTYTIDWAATDQYVIGTQNAAITNLTATGSAADGQKLMLRIKGDATPRAITWDSAKYVSSGVATLLATTAASKTHFVGLIYDGVLGKMVCIAVDATGY